MTSGSLQLVAHETEHADRLLLELVVAEDARESKEDVSKHRVAGRSRVVVELLLPRDEVLSVGGRQEKTAALLVSEEVDGEPREPKRLVEPAQLAGRDVKLVEAVRDVRVVLEIAGAFGLPGVEGPVQPPFGVGERPEQELRKLDGGVAVVARGGGTGRPPRALRA